MRVISRSDGHSGQSQKEEHKTCGIQALRRPQNLDCNSGQQRTGRRAGEQLELVAADPASLPGGQDQGPGLLGVGGGVVAVQGQ
jgi:hypothetical protein